MLMVLTLITIIAAGVLAAVNAVTAPQIDKINADNLAAGIKAVMGSKDIQVSEPWESDGFTVYDISDNAGEKLGKAVVTVQNGFGGPLKVLVGFNPEGDILGYTLLEHAETPGLGAKAGEWFQDKIIGVNPGKSNFTVSKDGGDIDAITASTITSRAFLLAIKNAYDKTIMELQHKTRLVRLISLTRLVVTASSQRKSAARVFVRIAQRRESAVRTNVQIVQIRITAGRMLVLIAPITGAVRGLVSLSLQPAT